MQRLLMNHASEEALRGIEPEVREVLAVRDSVRQAGGQLMAGLRHRLAAWGFWFPLHEPGGWPCGCPFAWHAIYVILTVLVIVSLRLIAFLWSLL